MKNHCSSNRSRIATASHSGRELDPAPPGSFSLVVLPDTQEYREVDSTGSDAQFENPILDGFTRWIESERERQRIAMVSHVGDVVGKNVEGQWSAASRAFRRIDSRVAYGISPGNRDMNAGGDTTLFQQTFPLERFQEHAWYGGSYTARRESDSWSGNNVNSYQLFIACGTPFVTMHLECNPPRHVLDWANKVLEAYQSCIAIVTTHAFLGPIEKPATAAGYYDDAKGRMKWRRIQGESRCDPETVWQECLQHHANLRLICCGDQRRTTAWRLGRYGRHGNLVHACLTDYSPLKPSHLEELGRSESSEHADLSADRVDPLRIYRFHVNDQLIEAITFDPFQALLVSRTIAAPQQQAHQFLLPCSVGAMHPR